MNRGIHEDLHRSEEIHGASERSFGLTVGGILVAIALWRAVVGAPGALEVALATVGMALAAAALSAPRILAPLNRSWIALGLLLSKIVSPVALALIYGLTIVPTGLIRRALGHEPLHLRFDSRAESYWVPKEPPGPPPESMPNQF